MSRIGRIPIAIPTGVNTKQEGGQLHVEGPKGKLSLAVPPSLKITQEGQHLRVAVASATPESSKTHGLYRALINNMVQGASSGFLKELEIVGVGFRAQLAGKQLSLTVGFSHPVLVDIPAGVTVEVPKPTSVIIKGADRQQVGQFAADVRRVYPPEPYKGKGIKYAGEIIRRKAGKAATGSGAKAG
ncbi:MAG: 50S ribosomal protein L6 [Candidatus Omnitrophica bacterium]|nr:50S ribosomal protein L6 [Candidatus Omnitrophota bacterium]